MKFELQICGKLEKKKGIKPSKKSYKCFFTNTNDKFHTAYPPHHHHRRHRHRRHRRHRRRRHRHRQHHRDRRRHHYHPFSFLLPFI